MIYLFIIIFFVFTGLFYFYSGLGVNFSKDYDKYSKELKDSVVKEFINNVPLSYNKNYGNLHFVNYAHYRLDDGYRYKDLLILPNKKICRNFELTDEIDIQDCDINLDEYGYGVDRMILSEFIPPLSDDRTKSYGLYIENTSFIQTKNDIKIPKLSMYLLELDKIHGYKYKLKTKIPINTYEIVFKKIENANRIIDRISSYIRLYGKNLYKITTKNPLAQEFAFTRMPTAIDHTQVINYSEGEYLPITEGKKTVYALIKNQTWDDGIYALMNGEVGYGLVTSRMMSLPNTNIYEDRDVEVVKYPINGSGSDKVYDLEGNEYPVSKYNSWEDEGTIYYTREYITDYNTLASEEPWYEKYDNLLKHYYRDLFKNFEQDFEDPNRLGLINLVGLDQLGALKRTYIYDEDSKELKIKLEPKTFKEYLLENFKVDFDSSFFTNPFLGKTIFIDKWEEVPFDIVVDNSSMFANSDFISRNINNGNINKLMDYYSLVIGLPYLFDHIDTLPDQSIEYGFDNADKIFPGLYYKKFIVTLVR